MRNWRRTGSGIYLVASSGTETSSCWETTVLLCHYGRKWVLFRLDHTLHSHNLHNNIQVGHFFEFSSSILEDQLWSAVARGLGAKRLAKMSRISSDGFRSPVVTMLLGDHSWVKHVDNGIRQDHKVYDLLPIYLYCLKCVKHLSF